MVRRLGRTGSRWDQDSCSNVTARPFVGLVYLK